MAVRHLIEAIGLVVMAVSAARAQSADKGLYPALDGQWVRNVGAQWDPSRPRGPQQQRPPLTAEYQAILESNWAQLAAGGEDYNPLIKCLPGGMPRIMIGYEPSQIIVTPATTYMRLEPTGEFRRIYTDGRDWPAHGQDAFRGYSIGRWVDKDGDGRYDALLIETRGFKGPRTFDADGTPLHQDNQTIVRERLALDRADPDLLRDEITTFDHALTRPWTVTRTYRRERNPIWPENICGEDNHHVILGEQNYFISSDGFLMPTRKDQPAPDLRNFERGIRAGR